MTATVETQPATDVDVDVNLAPHREVSCGDVMGPIPGVRLVCDLPEHGPEVDHRAVDGTLW